MQVVRAEKSDVDVAAKLFDEYRYFYCGETDLERCKRFLNERLEREESVIYLALVDGEPAGFTQLYPSFSSVACQRIWVLNDLFVREAYRRQSVGKRLLEAAKELGRATIARRLSLETARDNIPAQSLYKADGWIEDTEFLHYTFEL